MKEGFGEHTKAFISNINPRGDDTLVYSSINKIRVS